jgi:hypothetical protein
MIACSACAQREAGNQKEVSAYDAGKIAHEAAKKGEKALENAGHEIKKEARDVEKGWKEGGADNTTKTLEKDRK